MVAKKSPASGNKAKAGGTSKKAATSAAAAAKGSGWKLGAKANAGNAPKPEVEEGFTTDTAAGTVVTEQEDGLPPVVTETTDEPAPKAKRGRKASEDHSPGNDASDDSAVNLTNMTSDLVHGIERIERLAEEIAALKDDAKEFMSELKTKGYSTKIIRKVLARRAMDPSKRDEEDKLLGIYEEAIRGA